MRNDQRQAYIVHRTPSRLRLKFSERRHDQAFFNALQKQIRGWEGVLAVETNLLTASVLIRHRHTFDPTNVSRLEVGSQQGIALSKRPSAVSRPPLSRCPHVLERHSVWTDLASSAVKLVVMTVLGRFGVPVEFRPVRSVIELLLDALLSPRQTEPVLEWQTVPRRVPRRTAHSISPGPYRLSRDDSASSSTRETGAIVPVYGLFSGDTRSAVARAGSIRALCPAA